MKTQLRRAMNTEAKALALRNDPCASWWRRSSPRAKAVKVSYCGWIKDPEWYKKLLQHCNAKRARAGLRALTVLPSHQVCMMAIPKL